MTATIANSACIAPSTGATSSTAPPWRSARRCCRSGAGPWPSTRRPRASRAATDAYPPRRTGMRGSHAGSFEVAHQLRDGRGRGPRPAPTHTGETYDLVVVGGGLSGLAAALLLRRRTSAGSARVLVLDNHDDFGGHAKRNEFVRRRQAAGAERRHAEHRVAAALQPAVAPAAAPASASTSIASSRTTRPTAASTRALGLRSGALLRQGDVGRATSWRCGRRPAGAAAAIAPEYLDRLPISDQAKADMRRLQDPRAARLHAGPDLGREEGPAGADEPRALPARGRQGRQAVPVVLHGHRPRRASASAPTRFPALFGWEMGVPGFAGLKLEPTPDGVLADLPGGHHGRQKAEGGGGSDPLPRRQRHRRPPAGALADSRRGARHRPRRTWAPRTWTTRGSIAPVRPPAFA